MEQELFDLLSELEMRAEKERLQGLSAGEGLQILAPDSAKLLSTLATSNKAKTIVEIGSGVGYSTLWLAYAASLTGGKVITCEIDPAKAEEARANIEQAGVAEFVEVLAGDARELLRHREEPFDFLFIDG